MSLKRDIDYSSSSDDSSEEELSFMEGQNEVEEELEPEGENENPEIVNVNFDFSDPSEKHFSSLRQYLISYLPIENFFVSELADLIVKQVSVGTMIQVENEPEDVYGFITALSLHQYRHVECIQQIRRFLIEKCPEESKKDMLRVLNGKCGLVISERLVNMPYQLVPPLHNALHEDIEWALENEDNAELRSNFDFEKFIIISTCSVEKAKKKPSGKKASKASSSDGYSTAKVFQNFEDEFLSQASEISFTVDKPVRDADVATAVKKQSVVMVLSRKQHQLSLESFSALVQA